MGRRCLSCGNDLPDYVRADRHYCSDGCRKRAERARARGVAVTGGGGAGYMGVTDSPPPRPPGSMPTMSKEEIEARYPIEEDLTIPSWLRRVPDAPHWQDYDEQL